MLEPIVDAFRKGSKSFVFIGDSDTGKTTLCRKVAEFLLKEGLRVALIDADIGQSSLFLPATVSAKVLQDVNELNSRDPDYFFFVGLWNPALAPDIQIKATYRAYEFVKDKADVVLVDTTGLVKGRYGIKLKIEKFRILNPSKIIAIQKAQELQPLIEMLPSDRVLLLKPSEAVRIRSRTERILYRKKLYRDYFKTLYLCRVPGTRVKFLYNFTARHQRGLICALVIDGIAKALGVIDEYHFAEIEVLTPLEETHIERCLVGGVFIDEELYL